MKAAAFLFLSLVFIPVAMASDGKKSDITAQEKKLEDVKKKLGETEKAVERISKKETTVLEEIETANKAIRKSREELKKIDSSIVALGAEGFRRGGQGSRAYRGKAAHRGPLEVQAYGHL